ncbi:hypothetical protein PAXINDRAFT_85409 [Paxillus involutus ATCC 200175]|uniref:Uncharacterized protein n=1 Tax=Paxillus involutus ATCC 200175 TaxID=664439 RepID=A0A0C9TSM5_PAXIN|nr:hypothetical protein PAXINDRAFT_85409 [Paxillus involutus ATCC 200175]
MPAQHSFSQDPSPWCNLFTSSQWASYKYYGDLSNYYGNGYGQSLGCIQGVGYINEVIAHLTSQPVQDKTQASHTLDCSPLTFPFNKTFYTDFTDDNQMISIYSALGLFVQPHGLDSSHPDTNRNTVTHHDQGHIFLVSVSPTLTVEQIHL